MERHDTLRTLRRVTIQGNLYFLIKKMCIKRTPGLLIKCQSWLKLAQWFWKGRKFEKFTTTTTTTTTTMYKGEIWIRNGHVSYRHRWSKKQESKSRPLQSCYIIYPLNHLALLIAFLLFIKYKELDTISLRATSTSSVW